MNTLMLTTTAIACFFATLLLTGLLRSYAIHKGVMDHPNERSSHSTPTPRGGGMAILLSFLGSIGLLFVLGHLPGSLFTALFVGSLLIGGIGFWDDHSSLSAKTRILFHIAAAAFGIYQLDLYSIYLTYTGSYYLASAIWLFALISCVWLINLYNFMDGIDGLAATQALLAAGGGAAFALLVGEEELALAGFSLAGSALGFLVWNWAPAKIFMGDVGSGFLGYVFAILIFAPAWTLSLKVPTLEMWHGLPPLSWANLILIAYFVCDATVTLVRRMAAAERWWTPHRSHAYQHAANRHSHRRITLTIGGIILTLLCPIAYLVITYPKCITFVLPALFLLFGIVLIKCKAGMPNS